MADTQNSQLLSTAQAEQARSQAEEDPASPRPRAQLALHCWRAGQFEEAMEWIDSCLELDESNLDFYRIKANVLADMKLSGRALETAMGALASAPGSVTARILAVRMMLADLQPRKAQSMLDSILALEPGDQELGHVKFLQAQIVNMIHQAENDPLRWLSRKLKSRLSNVAGESG